MTTLKRQIEINAPSQVVFDVLANLELVERYNPLVIRAKYVSEARRGIGSARECDLGKDGAVRERVVGFEDGNWIRMELYEHSWPLKKMEWTTTVTPIGDATHVSQTMEYQMKFGPLGQLMDVLMMRKKFDHTLAHFFVDEDVY